MWKIPLKYDVQLQAPFFLFFLDFIRNMKRVAFTYQNIFYSIFVHFSHEIVAYITPSDNNSIFIVFIYIYFFVCQQCGVCIEIRFLFNAIAVACISHSGPKPNIDILLLGYHFYHRCRCHAQFSFYLVAFFRHDITVMTDDHFVGISMKSAYVQCYWDNRANHIEKNTFFVFSSNERNKKRLRGEKLLR